MTLLIANLLSPRPGGRGRHGLCDRRGGVSLLGDLRWHTMLTTAGFTEILRDIGLGLFWLRKPCWLPSDVKPETR